MLKLKLFGGGGIWIPETLADLAVFLDPAPKFSESVGEGFEPPEPLRTLQFSRLPLLSTQPSHRVYEKLAEWFLVRGKTAPFSRSGTPPLNAVCVRKNSNRFRPKFVGRAKFPPNPPSARPKKRPFRIEKLPKNLKKYRLKLHFWPKAGFPHF